MEQPTTKAGRLRLLPTIAAGAGIAAIATLAVVAFTGPDADTEVVSGAASGLASEAGPGDETSQTLETSDTSDTSDISENSENSEISGNSEAPVGSLGPGLDEVPVLGAVPELVDTEGWYNTEQTSLEAILAANEVVVIQFWTYSCHNCKATLPHLQALYADYGGAGLEIVGIHAPEFSFERDPDNVVSAMADLGVDWPVTLDQDKRNFHRWQEGRTAYWPRIYVVDAEGQIRFDHIGEGKYDELRNVVEQLLAAPA